MKREWMAVLVAAIIAGLAAPATAQSMKFSDSYTFLKAVKDRDAAKATDLVSSARGALIINARDDDTGDTALHIVVRERDANWLAFLLSRRPRADVQNKAGATPLTLAAQIGWVEGAELLMARGAAVDAPTSRGETPLILAVHSRDVPMIRLLLARGANPNRTDSVAGYSAIDYARQDSRDGAILRMLEAQPKKPEAAGPNF